MDEKTFSRCFEKSLKHPGFSLAKRFQITAAIRRTERQFCYEKPGQDDPGFVDKDALYLVEAADLGLYGKRAKDYEMPMPGFSAHSRENIRLTNQILKAERALKKGDRESEEFLRVQQQQNNYGKRCTDINLD